MCHKRTRINQQRADYPIIDKHHSENGYIDYEINFFEPEEDIDQDDYDREL